MSMARELATDLDISVDEDTIISNSHLEGKFNDWLFKNNKSNINILAAAITWPRHLDDDFGIIFISKFVNEGWEAEALEEDDEALKVKKIIEGWGQISLQLQWAWLVDTYGITRRGTRPRPNPPKYVKRSWEEIMEIADRSLTLGRGTSTESS